MKSLIALLLITCWNFYSFSQHKEIDSLGILLNNTSEDSVKATILNELSYLNYTSNPEKGIETARQAIGIARKLNIPKLLGQAYTCLGHNYSSLGNSEKANKSYNKALTILESAKDSTGVIKIKFAKGLLYFSHARYAESTRNYKEVYQFFKQKGDSATMARVLGSIAINNMYRGAYSEALSINFKALDIYQHIGMENSLNSAFILSNIGILYNHLEKYPKSLKYQQKAIGIYKREHYFLGVANSLLSIGNIYDSTNESQKAIDSYEKAYAIGKNIGNKKVTAASMTNLGIAYKRMHKDAKALKFLLLTDSIYRELQDPHNLAIVCNEVGEIYLHRNAQQNNDLRAGKRYFEYALEFANKSQYLKQKIVALDNLARVYEIKGNFKEALERKSKAMALKDSLFSSEKTEEIAQLEAQYRLEEQKAILKAENQKKRAIAQAEIKRQKLYKNISILGGSGIILFAVIGFMLYTKKRDAVYQAIQAEYQTKVADVELKALRSQLNPHFIFNALNSINDYISHHKIEDANHYLTKFARLMRLILEYSAKKEITIKEDLEALELYLQLEKLRLNNKFSYFFYIEKSIHLEHTFIPPLLLQPFIENAIWHGLSGKKGPGLIGIKILDKKNHLLFTIEDNGVGRKFNENQRKKGTSSVGIELTRNRIEIINNFNKTKGSVRLIDLDEGLRVEIEVPQKYYDDD
ncbi:tetratricopeptide repeat protein [Zunongwangia sp. H14]|uniref:tetratricopeptide repeat-containing sensor histidine kinase n=1 Tax=Zunongwangia sp. H14 TaxID=3240792 RepID=UPI003562517E